jgi:hypothetical protein
MRIGNRVSGPEISQVADEFKLSDSVAGVWPEPPNPEHLHIIVKHPPGERCVTALGQRYTDRVSTSSKLKLCQHQSLASDLTYHG